MSDLTKMTDDELDRSLERYRTLLNDLDWAPIEELKNHQAYLVSTIRRLEGEVERRRAGGGGR